MNLWKRQLKNLLKMDFLGEWWILLFSWEISVVQIELCIDGHLAWIAAIVFQYRTSTKVHKVFYTIVLVIISNSSSGLKKWVLHHTRAKEMLSFDKGSCHMQSFFVSSQWQFGCKQSPVQIPKCRIRGLRNRGKMPGWSGSRAGSSDC